MNPASAETRTDRERTADRLLRSTAARSYDPDLDVDWSAPLVEGAPFMQEHRCSLYGTELWERLSARQRLELGKHEAASVAGTGIWLEALLMRMLIKLAYHGDPASRHIQYAYTEIGDECRHSLMFARLIERMGTPGYGPHPRVHRLGTLLPMFTRGPAMWGAVLIGEEVTDRFQRELADDERIQPLMRMVNRIHIVEESRHIAFARAELTRTAAGLSGARLAYHRLLLADIAYLVTRSLINPLVYRSVGLDPREAHRVALANPHYQGAIRYSGEKIMAFLGDAGLVGAPATHRWRQANLLA